MTEREGPAAPAATETLRAGSLGTAAVVLMVVAAASPLATVIGLVPLSIAFGNGIGTPGAYVLAALVLACFAAGYVAMSRDIANAGAFYAYVARGLGRPAGVAAALVAILAYVMVGTSLLGIFGFFAHDVIARHLSIDLPWEVWSAAALALASVLAFREITLSAGVLGVALVLEITLLLIFSVAVLLDVGFAGFSLEVFSPSSIFAGAAGISLVYAFGSFIGFEGTAIYREEARDGRRTVRRATYAAIALIGGFYAITTWAAISAYGAEGAVEAATADPAGFVLAANERLLGPAANTILDILLVNSFFAAFLAFYNAIARYLFALGREGILPHWLAVTHPRHGSPYRAGFVGAAVIAAIAAAYAIAGQHPYLVLSTSTLGVGTLGLVTLQAATAFAAIRYLLRRPGGASPATIAATLVGGIGLTAAAVLIVDNYGAFAGVDSPVLAKLPWLIPLAALAGLALASWRQRTSPQQYALLGADHSQPEVS